MMTIIREECYIVLFSSQSQKKVEKILIGHMGEIERVGLQQALRVRICVGNRIHHACFFLRPDNLTKPFLVPLAYPQNLTVSLCTGAPFL